MRLFILAAFVTQTLFSCSLFSYEREFSEREERLIEHVISSIDHAEKGISRLNHKILKMQGLSSYKVRRFLNNICSLPEASYLEVGSWKGSTLISAIYGNEATMADAVAIDNWSELNGPRSEFLHNIDTFLTQKPRFYEVDCFSIDKSVFARPINIYFYDGNHSAECQEKAFTYFNEVLDEEFIAIVDDWNWASVREGTMAAFQKLGYEVLYERSLNTKYNGDVFSWWNGLYVAVIHKKKV